MTPCPDDLSLCAHASGDGDALTRTHVRQCLRCAARLQALRADLTLLHDALASGPLPRRGPARDPWPPAARWAMPLAAAALALLAFAWWRAMPAGTVAPAATAQFADLGNEVGAALFASREGFSTVEPLADHEMLAAALNGGLPCEARAGFGARCDYADLLDQ
ncbi:MAG: hypothetical protein SF182_03480 [Deltaproteobacteria bacterium]|nr:hypothetical protein [Deltaproteobacteria bacterium]